MNKEVEISNAKISYADITIERGFLLTAMIGTEGEGWGQGFGGWALGFDNSHDKHLDPMPNYCAVFLTRVMQIAGVERWEDLKGKPIRVKRVGGLMGKLVAIGHYLKDDWFNVEEEFAQAEAVFRVKTGNI